MSRGPKKKRAAEKLTKPKPVSAVRPPVARETSADRFAWSRDWIPALLLLAATLATYHPAWQGLPIWDDDAHITKLSLRSLSGLVRIWIEPGATQQYYPLVHSIFWVEYHLWGEATLGYHLVNVLLHVLSCLLLVQILRRLEMPAPWLAAAIFALHPIEVESVAWISELKNTLSGAFYFGSALAYLKFDRERHRGAYALALGLFALGLMSKSVIATLPAALLVIFWWRRGRIDVKKDILPLLPFFGVGVAAGVFTAWMERTYVGASGADFSFSLLERVLIAGRVFWFYLAKIVWPSNLMFMYPRWEISAHVWWQFLFPAAALALGAGLWAIRKRARWPLAAYLFYAGTLFPALGFINVYPFRFSFVADHFQYLAGLAPICVAAAGVGIVATSIPLLKPVLYGFCGLFLLIMGILSSRLCENYADYATIWRSTLAKNPSSWVARNNLGTALVAQGHLDEGITSYLESLKLKPDNADANYNLGSAYAKAGRLAEAIVCFQAALTLQPDYPEACLNLGVVFEREGRTDEAWQEFQHALELKPIYPEAQYNIGLALYQKGQTKEAVDRFRRALELKPDYPEADHNLAVALVEQGHLAEAAVHYERALKGDPHNAEVQNDLAWLYAACPLAQVRNGPRALELALQANAVAGGQNPMLLRTLAASYAETGQFSLAVNVARNALTWITPSSPPALRRALEAELQTYLSSMPFRDTTFRTAP